MIVIEKILTGVFALVLMFGICCLDTDPYPVWLIPMVITAFVGTVVGAWLLSRWYENED